MLCEHVEHVTRIFVAFDQAWAVFGNCYVPAYITNLRNDECSFESHFFYLFPLRHLESDYRCVCDRVYVVCDILTVDCRVHESACFQIDRRQHAAVAEVVDDPVSSYSHVCCQQSSLSVLEESDRSYGVYTAWIESRHLFDLYDTLLCEVRHLVEARIE